MSDHPKPLSDTGERLKAIRGARSRSGRVGNFVHCFRGDMTSPTDPKKTTGDELAADER